MRSRDIARQFIVMRCADDRDQKYISELTRRVSKALRGLRASGEVRSKQDRRGNLEWECCDAIGIQK